MLKGIDVDQRFEFSSKQDEGEDKTIFVFKPLSGLEMINLAPNMENMTGESIAKFLSTCIVEIKNFKDKSVEESLEFLPSEVISELLEFAASLNNLTDEDKKKS